MFIKSFHWRKRIHLLWPLAFIDGQSTEVDAPPNIIDFDEGDVIIDDEDAIPHDLAEMMKTSSIQRHPKTQFEWKESGQHTRQETHNLGLKKITDDKCPVPIRFEWDDKKTMMPLGEHASHWSNYLEELIREMPFTTLLGKSLSRSKSPKLGKEQGRMPAGIPMENSSTREYPLLIHTFFVTHTVGGVFVRDEDRALYGKQRGKPPGVGRVLSGRATGGCPPPPQSTVDPADVEKLKKSNKSLAKQVKMMIRLFRRDDKFSQMIDQFESSPDCGGPYGCGDDEPGGDEDGD
uniref:Uncharacterized protein n=1 Tax=Tanacetum cinerariifolium TaxID=118510 RepID=A0A699HA78_TANCI|nr:hypothetical protein [Tanacetum cinerariifolium]